MEFWGVEVKAGEPLEVVPGDDMLVHISQASLGEIKKDKGNELVCLYANIGGQKLVLGTLSAEKFPQISFDLVFEKILSYPTTGKMGVYSDSEFEIDLPHNTTVDNGKPQQLKQEKPESAAAKQVKIVEPNKDAKSPKENDDDSDKDSDESMDDEDESSEDEDMVNDRSASSEDEDDDENEDNEDDKNEISKKKETPKKAGPSKKRPTESVSKTPVPDKKAKFVTPQKTDGKKSDDKKSGGHVATPYPSKQAGKTPANTEKPKQQVQKSGGSFSCKSCNRSFNSENALQSHTKAKHTAAK
ncbi:hypothetical protein AAG906_036789 [Vitis piasezkii]